MFHICKMRNKFARNHTCTEFTWQHTCVWKCGSAMRNMSVIMWIPTQNYHFNLAFTKWETCALKQYIFTSCYDVGHQRFACMILEPCLNVILFLTQVFIQNESCVFHLKYVNRRSFTFQHAHICSAQRLTGSLWHCKVTTYVTQQYFTP